MSAPFGAPSYADLVQQVAALQDQVAQPLTLDDLPLTDLRSALIDNGPPLDLSVLALAQTVGTGLLVDAGTTKAKLASDVLSAFPQLLTAGSHKIAFGVAVANASASTVFTHSLGVTPIAVLLTPNSGGGSAAFNLVVTATTTTTFTVANGAGANTNVFWLAIG